MVVLIAIAVPTSGLRDLPPIAAAPRDALQLYGTLATAVGPEFDHQRSVCLIGPTSAEAAATLKRTSVQLRRGDTLVLYLSAHGELIEGRLRIPFSDADIDGRGHATIREIQEWLVWSPAERLVVLDTCHSGAALVLANAADVFDVSMTSVLASTGPFGRSTFTDQGSAFTNALCAVLDRLHSDRAALSLVRIAELIQVSEEEGNSVGCTINVREGRADAILPTSYGSAPLPSSFAQDVLATVRESFTIERQYLWFDLAKVPVQYRFDVLEQFLASEDLSEPSWLVRRAIGTMLESCRTVRDQWTSLCARLLESSDWMKCCVGLIGGRSGFASPQIHGKLLAVLSQSEAADAIWLAHLYLADYLTVAPSEAFRAALTSGLQRTSWGLIDIISRWRQNDADDVVRQVLAVASAEDRQAIVTHCHLAGITVPMNLDVLPAQDLLSLELAKKLYNARRRGRTVSADLKPLLSAIYGNWRDQLDVDIREWLRNRSVDAGIKSLNLCARLPAVETRMVIFQDLGKDRAMTDTYRDGLLWGLEDAHPWVRREAMNAFRHEPQTAARALRIPLSLSPYPGALDLCLEAARHGIDIDTILMQAQFPKRALLALQWAIARETGALHVPSPQSPATGAFDRSNASATQ